MGQTLRHQAHSKPRARETLLCSHLMNLTTYLYSEFHFPGLFGLHMNMSMSTNIYIFLTTRIITGSRLTTAPHNTG